MKTQIDVAKIQEILPDKRRILYLELVGLAAFFCAFFFSSGSLPSIGLFIVGAMGIARGGDERRWLRKLTTLMNE